MYELTEKELYSAIQYARSMDEDAGRTILNQFHLDQPELANAIFGYFPSGLAEENKEISYLFLELCFDILCIF